MCVEGERAGGMNWERHTDRSAPPCVKQAARGRLLNGTGASAGCSAMT